MHGISYSDIKSSTINIPLSRKLIFQAVKKQKKQNLIVLDLEKDNNCGKICLDLKMLYMLVFQNITFTL